MSRSQWKFNYFGIDFQKLKEKKLKENSKNNIYVLQNRATLITKAMVGLNIKLYNGIRYFSFKIENDMLGHCIGEFAPTKKKAVRKKKTKVKKN